MSVDFSAYKPNFADTTSYPAQINAFMDAVAAELNAVITANAAYRADAITTVTGNYTVIATDSILLINPLVSNITVTLPAAASSNQRRLTLYRDGVSTNTITISANVALKGFDAVESLTVDGNVIIIICDGTRWLRIG